MSRHVGVVMDPIDTINFKKDTTLGLLWSAQAMGWQLWYMEQADLFLRGGDGRAIMRPLQVAKDPSAYYTLGDAEDRSLAELDAILMRKDPPFDMEFVYTTHLLETAERQGTLIVNRCASLRDCNEKLFATQFPSCCPPLLVSRDMEQLKKFHAEEKDVIFKPLDGMGGSSIFRAKEKDPNVSVILETLTHFGGSGDALTRIAEANNINGTTASIKGILVDTNGHLAANEGEVDKLEGLVSFANAINVTADTTSLTMSFNLGEGMSLNSAGADKIYIGSGPFQAIMTAN